MKKLSTLRAALLAATLVAPALMSMTASGHAYAYDDDGLDRSFRVVNRGNDTIWSVWASSIDDPSYGVDLLYDQTIPSGDYAWVKPEYPNGYCRFDVKVKYQGGAVVELWDVNLCEISKIASNERRARVVR